jgi:hypothetical protein
MFSEFDKSNMSPSFVSWFNKKSKGKSEMTYTDSSLEVDSLEKEPNFQSIG